MTARSAALLLALTLPLLCPRASHPQNVLRNGGFEEGPATGFPAGWLAPDNGYDVDIVTDSAFEGLRALRFHRRGALLSPQTGWRLAHEWYRDKVQPEWRRHTLEETEALFERLGLTGASWGLR